MGKLVVLRYIFLLLLTFLGLLFWSFKSFDILNEQDNFRFTTNTLSGVRLSRHIDLVPPAGRVEGTNAYSSFLTNSTALISKKLGKQQSFIDQPYSLAEELNYWDSKAKIFNVSLLPHSNEKYLFGVQYLTRLKLSMFEGDVTTVTNRWVVLSDRSGTERMAFLDHIDRTGIVWIKGDIPINYFPTSMRVLPVKKLTGEFLFAQVTDITNAVRGGIVADGIQRSIIVRQLPYLENIPFLTTFNYMPRIGDVVRLASGTTRVISDVVSFDGNFLLELDSPIKPYLDSYNDIISIRQANTENLEAQTLKFSSLTNSEFILGKERHIKIFLDLDEIQPNENDLIYTYDDVYPYVVDQSNGQEVAIDILKTIAMNSCIKRLDTEDSILDKKLEHSCKASLNSPDLFQNSNSKFYSGFSESDYSGTTITNMFNHGLDKNFFIHCDKCPQTAESTVKALPTVNGAGEIWETYPGSALNLYYGKINPAEPEMIIHALGEESAANYYEKFERVRPSFVALTKPRQFTSWLYNWHWRFYESLLLNYREYYSNSDFSLWYRDDASWVEASATSESLVTPDMQDSEVRLPIIGKGLEIYSVSVHYDVANLKEWLPVIGRSARLIVEPLNTEIEFPSMTPVSLPLTDKKFSFPVFVGKNGAPVLKFHLIDPFGTKVKLEVKQISWRRLQVPKEAIKGLLYYTPPYKLLAHSSNLEE